MSDNKNNMDELVEGHEYDGIREFNNPAPFWWQLFFYISIAFGIGYFSYYQLLGGPTLDDELSARLEKIKAAQAQVQGSGPNEADLLALMSNADMLKVGEKVFIEKCAACHMADGGGLVGPNLVDNYWIHGKGQLLAIYNLVRDGVGDKGMPPWGPMLSADELTGVSLYVKSLKGKPVAKAKEPQGEMVTE